MKEKRLKQLISCLLPMALALCLLSGCGGKKEAAGLAGAEQQGEAETAEVRWQDYNGKRIGVLVGPLMEDATAKCFPDSEYLLFNSYPDCATALLAGRIDGFLGDEPGMISMHAENPAIDYIHESLTENNYAFAFRKDDPESAALCDELDEFLAKSWADGTMRELEDIWLGMDESRKVVDMSDLTGENGTIRVVTTSTDMPWSYIKDGKNVGYDIDLVVRFCRERGYKLVLGDVDFAGRIPAVQSGKYDFSTDMNVTPERMEQVRFCSPTAHGGIVLAVKASDLGAAQTAAAETGASESMDAMAGKRIGVMTGSIQDAQVAERFPDAERLHFSSMPDMLAALRANKIDSFACPEALVRHMMTEAPDLDYLKEYLGDGVHIGAVFPKTEAGQALCDEFNAFIRELRSGGEYEEIQNTWFGADETKRAVPDLYALPGPNGVLRMAADTSVAPFIYIKDGEPVGIDIDMVVRFCKAYGYGLEVVPMDFAGVLASVAAGKADFACCGIAYTAERAESVLFSETYYESKTVVAVLKSAGAQGLADFAHAKIGVATGTNFPDILAEYLPEAEVLYFNTTADRINALKSGKIAAFMEDSPVAHNMMAEDDALAIFPEEVGHFDFAFAFTKNERGQALCDELSFYLRGLKADGTLDRLQSKWFNSADLGALESPDYRALPATNGTLQVVTSEYPPFCLSVEGFYSGYDIEILAMFCRDNGYAMEIHDYGFDGGLPAVQSGKSDVACSGISITEERMETMHFSEPNYSGGAALVVLKSAPAAETGGFWRDVAASFEKTFIRESRWKLFVQGIGTTLLITIASIVLGTVLGFGVYLLCRNGNPVANGVTRFFVWLVHGMPMVVLLMILYYIIFGKVAISGTVVAIIGFTLVFGASVFGMLKSGVGAVEKGQTEAAYALGYTDRRAFFRVVLPQALPHFFAAYKGEITATIKATAIVGYVAVQDLTKMGDIVRSRTYEAFFPLIAVAIIYFILAGTLTAVVNRLGALVDPRRRKRDILYEK